MPKYTSVKAVDERIEFLKSEIERLSEVRESIVDKTVLGANYNELALVLEILDHAFKFAESPEGRDYWMEVVDKLRTIRSAAKRAGKTTAFVSFPDFCTNVSVEDVRAFAIKLKADDDDDDDE